MMTPLLLLYAIVLLIFIARTQLQARKSGEADWNELADTLYAVRIDAIFGLKHLYHLDRPVNKAAVKTNFSKIGGNEGLYRMHHNLQVMIKIAHKINARSRGDCSLAVSQLQKTYFFLRLNIFILRMFVGMHYFGPCTLASMKHVAGAYQRGVEQLLELHECHAPQKKAHILAACNWQVT